MCGRTGAKARKKTVPLHRGTEKKVRAEEFDDDASGLKKC